LGASFFATAFFPADFFGAFFAGTRDPLGTGDFGLSRAENRRDSRKGNGISPLIVGRTGFQALRPQKRLPA